jgi:hypothetical protein
MATPTAAAMQAFVAGMLNDAALRASASAAGLALTGVTWADNARAAKSSVGPNITDVTLELVAQAAAGVRAAVRLPMLRHGTNFTDPTSDAAMDAIKLRVGNEAPGWDGATLTTVTLTQYLADIARYSPQAPAGQGSLLAAPTERDDSKVLLATQACVLPTGVPFNVHAYSYQGYDSRDPAVLVVVGTAQGTTAQVVAGRVAAALRFNHGGYAADWVAKHVKQQRLEQGKPVDGPLTPAERAQAELLVVQVPLLQKPRPRSRGGFGGFIAKAAATGAGSAAPEAYYYCDEESVFPAGFDDDDDTLCGAAVAASFTMCAAAAPAPPRAVHGFGAAMLSTTPPSSTRFNGYAGLEGPLRRNPAFPVRVTVQKYKCTDGAAADGSAGVTVAMMEELAAEVKAPYLAAAAAGAGHGSLVVDGAAAVKRATATAVTGPPPPAAAAPPTADDTSFGAVANALYGAVGTAADAPQALKPSAAAPEPAGVAALRKQALLLAAQASAFVDAVAAAGAEAKAAYGDATSAAAFAAAALAALSKSESAAAAPA